MKCTFKTNEAIQQIDKTVFVIKSKKQTQIVWGEKYHMNTFSPYKEKCFSLIPPISKVINGMHFGLNP